MGGDTEKNTESLRDLIRTILKNIKQKVSEKIRTTLSSKKGGSYKKNECIYVFVIYQKLRGSCKYHYRS